MVKRKTIRGKEMDNMLSSESVEPEVSSFKTDSSCSVKIDWFILYKLSSNNKLAQYIFQTAITS